MQHPIMQLAMKRLRQAREEQGMCQLRAAMEAELQQCDWSSYECGKRPASLAMYSRMLDALGLEVADVVLREKDK